MNYNWCLAKKKGAKPPKPNGPKNFKPMGPPHKPAPRAKTVSSQSSTTVWGANQQSVLNSSSAKSGSSERDTSKIIVAVTECRGDVRSEVGLAAIDLSLPNIILCQMADTQSYVKTLTKINIINPTEVLVPSTLIDNPSDRLTKLIKNHFRNVKMTPIPRKFFNRTNGMDSISQLCLPNKKSLIVGLRYKYYALAAVAALLQHLQNDLFQFYANETLDIIYEECDGHAIIDVATADRLELVASTKPLEATRFTTLFGVLNYCRTRIGIKCLRTCILQPPCDPQIIENRLQCVAELLKKPDFHTTLQGTLQKISIIGQLLNITTVSFATANSFSSKQLNYLLLVNKLIDLIEPVRDILANFEEPLFKRVKETLESDNFISIADLIRRTINPAAEFAKKENDMMQRCFAIKTGINDLLDLMRRIYSERLQDMSDYVNKLGEKHNLPLVLENNNTKGYHIVMKLNKQQRRTMHSSELPNEFISVQRLAGRFTMKTMELINISTRLDDILYDVVRLSNAMIQDTITELKKYIPFFYKLCEDIADLDVLQSLAEASRRGNYIKPKFGEFTEIIKGRHPMLDLLLDNGVNPNNIIFDSRHNVQIITGPNGSGKSIYIRQIMLLQIMAQVGCYIPAESAILRPIDRMFARAYLEDNFECGASTFTFEIHEIKYMLTLLTDNSLFIVDEICRSTSAEEGAALGMAICEKFCHTSAFFFITTHYTMITKLKDMYFNVMTWQMETLSSGEGPEDLILKHQYNLIPGVTTLKHYGVYVVKNIWPDDLKADVYRILRQLKKPHKDLKVVKVDDRLRLKYELETNILKLKSENKLTETALNQYLNHYVCELQKLGVEFTNNFVLSESREDVESDSSSYRRLSNFLGQDSDNINKLIPEVSIETLDSEIYVPGRQIEIISPQIENCPSQHEPNNLDVEHYVNFSSGLSNCNYSRNSHIEEINKTHDEIDISLSRSCSRSNSMSTEASHAHILEKVENINAESQCISPPFQGDFQNQSNSFGSFGTPPSPPATQMMRDIEMELHRYQFVENTETTSLKISPIGSKQDEVPKNSPKNEDSVLEAQNHSPRIQFDFQSHQSKRLRFDSFGTPPSPPATQIRRDIEMELHGYNFGENIEETPPQTQLMCIMNPCKNDNNLEPECNYPQIQKHFQNPSKRFKFESLGTPSPPATQMRRDIEMELQGYQFGENIEATPPESQLRVARKGLISTNPRKNVNYESDTKLTDDDINLLMDEIESCSKVMIADAIKSSQDSFKTAIEDQSIDLFSQSPSISYSPVQSPIPIQNDESYSKSSSSLDFGTKKVIAVNESTDKEPSSKSTNASDSKTAFSCKTRKRFAKKFKPPKRLTKKEIEAEFYEQDKQFYESSITNPECSKELAQKILNRPSVKQVQQSKHLAFVRRTGAGVEVVSFKENNTRKPVAFKRKLSSSSENNIDVSIFSDENAKTFERFINSKEVNVNKFNFKFKDSKTFSFSFGDDNPNVIPSSTFKFQPNSNFVDGPKNAGSIFENCLFDAELDL